MSPPRVLVMLGTNGAWSRGILRGFMAEANAQGWQLLHYDPTPDLTWILNEWKPTVAVIGPEPGPVQLAQLGRASLVSVTVDRSADEIASVCLDEDKIASLAAEHLRTTGLRQVTTFRFDESPFAIARERAFVGHARAVGANAVAGWGCSEFTREERGERPAAIVSWLRALPRPCGIFTMTDGWGRVVTRYAREAGLRIPEDLALIGADNDVLECELISPPLSSVILPWQEVGRIAAMLVRDALGGHPTVRRRVVSPITVAARRSSDVLAVDDPLVAGAVAWIRDHAERHLSVTMVARAVGGGRQRLERRFRRVLDRTIQDEIRRAHVDAAKSLLASTHASLAEVAERSGFTNASLLNVAFRRETGMPPGAYRRRVQLDKSSDE